MALTLLLPAARLGAAAPANDDCLTCHDDRSAAREAEKTSVFVDGKLFAGSAHGKAGMSCVDCHADLASATDFPHAARLAKVDCAPCHDQQASDYAKSFHAESRAKSEKSKAARCVDCHGMHDMLSPKDAASKRTISTCRPPG